MKELKELKSDLSHIDKRKILLAAAGIALGARALRSYKLEGEHLTFDVSVWGDNVKSVFSDVIDDSKKVAGRLAGKLVLGPDNEIQDVIPDEEIKVSPESLQAMADAVSKSEGWSGQDPQNSLQKG